MLMTQEIMKMLQSKHNQGGMLSGVPTNSPGVREARPCRVWVQLALVHLK